jgi:beta-glucosidase
VNIYRAPVNGRNFEYFREDPFLTSSIAVGYIKGMQSQGVSATVKHFVANNSEYLRRTRTPSLRSHQEATSM